MTEPTGYFGRRHLAALSAAVSSTVATQVQGGDTGLSATHSAGLRRGRAVRVEGGGKTRPAGWTAWTAWKHDLGDKANEV